MFLRMVTFEKIVWIDFVCVALYISFLELNIYKYNWSYIILTPLQENN